MAAQRKVARPQPSRTPSHPQSLRLYLEAADSRFAALPMKQRCYIASAMTQAACRSVQHFDDPEAVPLHWQTRRLAFRAGEFEDVNGALDWLAQTADKRPGVASAWRLTEKGEQIMADFDDSTDALNRIGVGLETADGKKARKPQKSVATRTRTGIMARQVHTSLPVDVRINGHALLDLNDAAKAWLEGQEPAPGCEYAFKVWQGIHDGRGPSCGPQKAVERATRAANQSRLLLSIAMGHPSPGQWITQSYAEVPSGRLYSNDTIALQTVQREVKRAALAGCYEYDFEACHFALLDGMARNAGIHLPAVQDYLADKKAWRERIAFQAGVNIADAKVVATSLIYGAGLQANPGKALHDMLGGDVVKRLNSCPEVTALQADVKAAQKDVVEAHRRPQDGRITNAAHRLFDEKKTPPARRQAAALAHILQGAESEALRSCMSRATGLLLIQHDGFTCSERQDVGAIEAGIEADIGYRLRLSEERL